MRWLRSQPAQEELVLAAYYDDPLVAAAERYRRSPEWEAIREFLEGKSGRALDVGAGRGIASYALARDGFDVVALEPDPSDLVGAGAIRKLSSSEKLMISVVEEPSEHIPFDEEYFDVVFARAALHHTRNLALACQETFRVLKPGGVFVAVREHVISRNKDLDAFLAAHPPHHLYGGENAFILSEYKNALASAGFIIRRVLKPLASPINYFPHTGETLRDEIVTRLVPNSFLRPLARRVLAWRPAFSNVVRLLSLLDFRPGRLYSFVCEKPKS